MAQIQLEGNGFNEYEAVAVGKTLDLADAGVVQNVTESVTVTLPAVGTALAGTTYIVRVGEYGLTVTIDLDNADYFFGAGLTPADGKSLIFTNQPAGSFITLVSNGVVGFGVSRVTGTFTREA